jgi:hypothetical protein
LFAVIGGFLLKDAVVDRQRSRICAPVRFAICQSLTGSIGPHHRSAEREKLFRHGGFEEEVIRESPDPAQDRVEPFTSRE